MNYKYITVIAALLITGTLQAQEVNVKSAFREAELQTRVMLRSVAAAKPAAIASAAGSSAAKLVSPRTIEIQQLKLVKASDWTSGFFPGELWYLYAYTKNPAWEKLAERYTTPIEAEQWNGRTHDMGFKVYSSVGNGYLLTHNAHYKTVLIQAAKTLSTRFNKTAGVIRSWDHNKDKWAYPVIIDNMLNLELLFEASKLTGDKTYYNIAVSHANKTMLNHFRKDYSSFHVVDYDTTTGAVIKKTTHQGYSDASAWARGQAWGLYGYTMCYRETKDPKYLQQAMHIAHFIFNHPNMPKDLVPYWDFNAPGIPNEPRDASAAAVMASALLELSTYSKKGAHYKELAEKIMTSLTDHYRAKPGEDFGFILLHSTGSKPSNSEVDVPLSYADYYYLEALWRLDQLSKGKSLF